MNRKALKTFTQKYRTNMLFVLPSSIHEMIIAPYDSSLNLDELSVMVEEINETRSRYMTLLAAIPSRKKSL